MAYSLHIFVQSAPLLRFLFENTHSLHLNLQLPLTLLRTATGSPVLVELKSGDTYNGRLTSCDAWMNMNLTEVICTSSDGERFWKLPGCYIRGSAIKYLRLPPPLLEQAAEQAEKEEQQRANYRGGGRGGGRDGRGRGGRGGRGRSSGGRGRGRGGRGGGRQPQSSSS